MRRFVENGKKIIVINGTGSNALINCSIQPSNTYIRSPGPILLPSEEKTFGSSIF
jgi:hypothetical protein